MAPAPLIKPMQTAKPRYTPKIKTPHQLQSIRIQRKLLFKAYGLAVSRQLANTKGVKSVSSQQGAGAVYIARSFDFDCLDAETHNVAKKRIETPTSTKHNNKINVGDLVRILRTYTNASVEDKELLSNIVNYTVIACGYEQKITNVGPEKVTENKTIVDVFHVKQNGKEYTKKIMFSAGTYWEREVTFGNSSKSYTLLYAQDASNEHMFLVRLTPNNPVKPASEDDVVIKDKVYESLVIMNKFRKLEISLSPKPNFNKGLSTASNEALGKIASEYLRTRISLMNELAALPQEAVQAKLDSMLIEFLQKRVVAEFSADTFHPTYAFLRTKFPVLRYLPTASSPENQTEETIPYLSQVLTDVATLHWIYAGLRAVAATMLIEMYDKKGEAEYNAYIAAVDQFLFSLLFEKELNFRGIEQQSLEEMLKTTALAADLVSKLYVSLSERPSEAAKKDMYTRQLVNLYKPDEFIMPLPNPNALHYGHRIAVRLFMTTAVRTQVGDNEPSQKKPVILTLKNTTPWTSVSDSSETWNASVRFTLYRKQMLDLVAWMGDVNEKPAWVANYTTKSIFNWWDAESAAYNKKLKLPRSSNKEAVIAVSLDVQQQLELHVHTYLKQISGTSVKK